VVQGASLSRKRSGVRIPSGLQKRFSRRFLVPGVRTVRPSESTALTGRITEASGKRGAAWLSSLRPKRSVTLSNSRCRGDAHCERRTRARGRSAGTSTALNDSGRSCVPSACQQASQTFSRRWTPEQREAINLQGQRYGCVTCGTTIGPFVGHHDPGKTESEALQSRGYNTPNYNVSPQCVRCSNIEGGLASGLRRALGTSVEQTLIRLERLEAFLGRSFRVRGGGGGGFGGIGGGGGGLFNP
jgi:hypothetical protein